MNRIYHRNNPAVAVRSHFLISILINPRCPAYLRLVAKVALDCDAHTGTAEYAPGQLVKELSIDNGNHGMGYVFQTAIEKEFITPDSTPEKVTLNSGEIVAYARDEHPDAREEGEAA